MATYSPKPSQLGQSTQRVSLHISQPGFVMGVAAFGSFSFDVAESHFQTPRARFPEGKRARYA
jgi:hypothetical protein